MTSRLPWRQFGDNFPHLSYSKIGPFLESPRALGPLGPTQSSQIQLTYTSQHQPDTSQPFPGPHKMFPFFGHFFPNFKANVSTCFPAIFRLPRNFPAGYSCPTRSTLTSPRPRIMTSRLPWRQFGDNFPHLSYSKIGPFLGSPRALGPLGPTQSSQIQLTYTSQHQPDTSQPFPGPHKMFPFFGHFFPNFKANVSTCFPAIFRLPRNFPAGYSCPTRSTLTSPRPRIMTSRLPWRQFGDNFPHLSYSKIGPFLGSPRALGPLGPTQSSQIQLTYTSQHQPDTSQPFPGPHKMFPFFGHFFPNFKANVSTCFPAIFRLPRNFPAGYSCPTRSTITSPRPRIMTSRLPWRQFGDNFPHLSYSKIGPFLGSPRALGPLGPTQSSQIQLTYTSQHQPDTSQPFPGPHKMFPFFGHFFPNFKANVSTCFPAIFRLPRNFPAGYSCPTRSTLTSPRPRIMTSRLPWRQFGDNFPHLSYSKIGPFLGSPRALGPLGPTQSSQIQLTYTSQHQPDTSQPFPGPHKMFPFFGHFFPNFKANVSTCFSAIFRLPRNFPAGYSCPTRSTLTSPRPRIMTSRLPWRQFGDNFPHLSYSKIGPFLGSPRALGPLGPTQSSQIQLTYTSQHQPDTSQPFPGPHKMFPFFGHFFPISRQMFPRVSRPFFGSHGTSRPVIPALRGRHLLPHAQGS